MPPVDGYVMVLQPEEPKISLSGVHHFARAASEFESPEGVFLFPELRIISTITREVEPEGEGDEDPTGNSSAGLAASPWLEPGRLTPHGCYLLPAFFFPEILRDLDVLMLFLGLLLESDPWSRAHCALRKPTWRVLSSFSSGMSGSELPLCRLSGSGPTAADDAAPAGCMGASPPRHRRHPDSAKGLSCPSVIGL